MLLPARVPSPFVVALVATCDRPELLRRALASIAAQTRPPDVLSVVEDRREMSPEVRRVVSDVAFPENVDVILLGNRRTPGAAGAWGTGLDEAARRFSPLNAIYVAILDDDDWWEPDHVAACLAHAVDRDLDMVAPATLRHDDEHPEGREQQPPAVLSAEIALVKNPHVQGSSLFVRLSALLEAGMFDESLQSTTDRDLLIRLADIDASFAPLSRVTVHHDARGDRPRLSSRASDAKIQGLARFWQKHRRRMNEEQRGLFEARARALFGTEVTSMGPAPAQPAPPAQAEQVSRSAEGDSTIALVVGIAADGDEAGVARVTPLLEDLLTLQSDERVAALDVVIVENGDGGGVLRSRVDAMIRRGLRCYLADVARQQASASAGFFGPGFVRRPGRVGISEARAITQRHVRRLMRPGSIAWILDDDKRLAPLVHEDGRLIRRPFDVVGTIARLRAMGSAVVLGVDTGAAPLPAASTLRTQMVDLASNLAAMRALGPDALWPDGTEENLALAQEAPDFYYDLARPHTWHLERPFWFRAEPSGARVRDAFLQLCEKAPRVLAGEQVFRPLFVDGRAELTLRPSIRRGGNTLVFDADALVDVPQIVPSPDGRPTRRSDMIWALLNARIRGRRVDEAPFAVYHDRSDAAASALDPTTLIDDIRGYALCSTLVDVMGRWPAFEGPPDEMSLLARDRYQKYLVERTAALVLSFHRARGAARAARLTLMDPRAWWAADGQVREAVEAHRTFLERTLAALESGELDRVRAAVATTPPFEIGEYVRSLREKLDEAAVPVSVKPAWIRAERERIAQAQVERLASPANPLRLLGAGHEGIVLTDGREVFKYLDLWRARGRESDRAFLRSLIGKWTHTQGLYPLRRLIEDGPHVVLTYPYEPTEPYGGGHAAGLVQLLRECREQGVAFRNMHPRNLRVAGDRVRLVDYGADLRPLDAGEWRHMVRRAWLCFRWAHDPDLDLRMQRALREDIPELMGWERLERAVLAGDARDDLHKILCDAVVQASASRLLDYGCGSGRLASDLATRGIRALGYDPRSSPRWADSRATFTTDRTLALRDGPHDVVLCSLVLCTIEGDAEYRAVLSDIRAAVRDDGLVMIAVCNPLHTLGGDTPLQRRIVRPDNDPDRRFIWTKRVNGALRRDVHRPLHMLRRDLLRAGLYVESILETETVDLERLEPASDFMVLKARAVVPGAKVSLLVRASAMEWRTLPIQIGHVVEQLEGPHAFHERIVVLDSRRDRFLRPHAEADIDAARSALTALVDDGTIDRVVELPKDHDAVAALNERWFGLAATDTHATDGTPIAASLVGFESCAGDFVLHVDDDLLIARRSRFHDYLSELVNALDRDPEALCASLGVCRDRDEPWSTGGTEGAWRVEVRATLMHRDRLLASRPWPNEQLGPALVRSWYRSLDARICERGLRSLRGGGCSTFFIHPPNERKRDRDAWLAMLDRVRAGHIPPIQIGRVDLVGDLAQWLGPRRAEKIVVVACGRNVPAGRVARFRESLAAQTERSFGVVAIEDGGSRTSAEVVRSQLGGFPNATVLTLPERRGALANIVWALRYVCVDPDSIIVLVDLDDALLGDGALARIARELDDGADLTVGGMRRTDKIKPYPPNFVAPRTSRGGNVWQHLRAFRRALFDRVPDEALRLDGAYADLAWDWALMLPLVELATEPRYIDEPLYLYEPSGVGKSGEERAVRERIIAAIVSKPSLRLGGQR